MSTPNAPREDGTWGGRKGDAASREKTKKE